MVHTCVGTQLREKRIRDQIVRFECPSCGQPFYPLWEFGDDGSVHWFAAQPSKKMRDVASSADIWENLKAIVTADPPVPVYEKVLFVRTDPPAGDG